MSYLSHTCSMSTIPCLLSLAVAFMRQACVYLSSDPDVCRLVTTPQYFGEIPTGSHAEWNGDVRVKRQTRPRFRVGILLSIPPSSVDAERTYSAAGVLCTRVGSRLSDKSIDKLYFLRSYYQKNKQWSRTIGSDWFDLKRASWQFLRFTGRASK